MNEDCHIPFQFFVCKDTKQLKWRDLMGPDKLIFFENIKLCDLLPTLPNVEKIQSLWKDFMLLHRELQRKSFTQTEVETFGTRAKKWVEDFIVIYQYIP